MLSLAEVWLKVRSEREDSFPGILWQAGSESSVFGLFAGLYHGDYSSMNLVKQQVPVETRVKPYSDAGLCHLL
jgi:hypothetical protein